MWHSCGWHRLWRRTFISRSSIHPAVAPKVTQIVSLSCGPQTKKFFILHPILCWPEWCLDYNLRWIPSQNVPLCARQWDQQYGHQKIKQELSDHDSVFSYWKITVFSNNISLPSTQQKCFDETECTFCVVLGNLKGKRIYHLKINLFVEWIINGRALCLLPLHTV